MPLKTVYVSIHRDPQKTHGIIDVGFSKQINLRGTDFRVYTNHPFVPMPEDSALLATLINELRSAELGIEQMSVTACSISLYTSGAASIDRIKRSIYKAIRSIQLRPEHV